jgi:hypothetical protein
MGCGIAALLSRQSVHGRGSALIKWPKYARATGRLLFGLIVVGRTLGKLYQRRQFDPDMQRSAAVETTDYDC